VASRPLPYGPPVPVPLAPVPTARLDLVPLAAPLVAALARGDLDLAASLAPFPVDATTFAEDAYVLRLRHEQLEKDPDAAPWLWHAAVRRDDPLVVGRVGFHAAPDAEGTVEIGYAVRPDQRRQGYALEMTAGLLDWARAQGVRRCLGSVSPGNAASKAVLARLGFVRTGDQIDEVDGFEEVHTLVLG
jgi:RimJ/RimL family protein N-acetyltransferase